MAFDLDERLSQGVSFLKAESGGCGKLSLERRRGGLRLDKASVLGGEVRDF